MTLGSVLWPLTLVAVDAFPDAPAVAIGQTPVAFALHHDFLANRRQFGLPVFLLGLRVFRHMKIFSKGE